MKTILTVAFVTLLSLLAACSSDTKPTSPKKTETPTWYEDADLDGYGNAGASVSVIAAPEGYVADGNDCDDSDEFIHPGASETPLNGIDEDCDGSDLLALYPDGDSDGYGDENASAVYAGAVTAGFIENAQDCDDTNPAVNPAASEIDDNGIDDNCDGLYNDRLSTWYADVDGDGFGDAGVTQQAVNAPANYADNADDCNDNNGAIHPDANELAANGIDENCDGLDLYVLYPDTDGDGYGDKNTSAVLTPTWLADHVDNNLDCDDTLDVVNPDGTETNDQHDNDCDEVVNDGPFAVGDYGPAGGIVFQTDGTHGYEAAPEDQSTYAAWGCYGTDLPGASGTAIGTGAQNTADILAGCPSAPAALAAHNYTLNGYDDWFLPSIDELTALYAQMAVVGGLAVTYYWSSTESHANYVQCKAMAPSGNQQSYPKNYHWRVRAIRAF